MTAHRLAADLRTCTFTGKRSYADQETAEHALRVKQRAGLPVVRAYRCCFPICGGWHLTSEGLLDRRAR